MLRNAYLDTDRIGFQLSEWTGKWRNASEYNEKITDMMSAINTYMELPILLTITHVHAYLLLCHEASIWSNHAKVEKKNIVSTTARKWQEHDINNAQRILSYASLKEPNHLIPGDLMDIQAETLYNIHLD